MTHWWLGHNPRKEGVGWLMASEASIRHEIRDFPPLMGQLKFCLFFLPSCSGHFCLGLWFPAPQQPSCDAEEITVKLKCDLPLMGEQKMLVAGLVSFRCQLG